MPRSKVKLAEIVRKLNSEYGDNIFDIVNNELFCQLCCGKLKPRNAKTHVISDKHKLASEKKHSPAPIQFPDTQFNQDLYAAFYSARIPLYKLQNVKLREFLEKYSGRRIGVQGSSDKDDTKSCSSMQFSEHSFNKDLCAALLSAKIPIFKLQNDTFKEFLENCSGRKVPSHTVLRRNYVPLILGSYTKKVKECVDETADSDGYKGDLDLSDSGAPSVDGNEASDGAGPAEGNDEGSSFSRDDFETCDLSEVKVKVEHTDDFCSEPETKRSRVEEYQEESKLEEVLSILRDLKQSYSASQGPNDRFSLYGQHVANKLRGYSEKTSAIVEHAINNILFEADMGNYDGIHTALPSHDDSVQ